MTTIWSQEIWKQTFLKTKKYNRWKLIDDWTKWVVFPTKSVPIHLCATKHRKVNGLHISFSPPPLGDYCKMCFCSLLSPYFPIFPKKKNVKRDGFHMLQGMFITCSVFLDWTDTKNRRKYQVCVKKQQISNLAVIIF